MRLLDLLISTERITVDAVIRIFHNHGLTLKIILIGHCDKWFSKLLATHHKHFL